MSTNAAEPATERFPEQPGVIPGSTDPAARDAALVLGATAAVVALSIHFELDERLYRLTRHWEYFQLDELTLGLLALSIGLIWLAWRRYRHARRELLARARTEARLVEVLAENRALAQEHLRIQEEERRHLARELHDELGQYLNAIKLDATAIQRQAGADPTGAGAAAIVRTVDHLYEVVSGMIARLRPVGLEELGLAAAIEHCVDQWRQRLPQTQFSLILDGALDDLDDALSVTLYRVIQEGLTNLGKHAQATQVRIELQRLSRPAGDDRPLRLRIQDNGRGLNGSASGSRFGLSGMRERVELAGGSFALHSAPGAGLSIEAALPMTLRR